MYSYDDGLQEMVFLIEGSVNWTSRLGRTTQSSLERLWTNWFRDFPGWDSDMEYCGKSESDELFFFFFFVWWTNRSWRVYFNGICIKKAEEILVPLFKNSAVNIAGIFGPFVFNLPRFFLYLDLERIVWFISMVIISKPALCSIYTVENKIKSVKVQIVLSWGRFCSNK